MAFHLNKDFLDEEDLGQFYKFTNKIQKKYTQSIKNPEKIDLFIVLDISGSMGQTCNKIVNTVNIASGFIVNLVLAAVFGGGVLNTGRALITGADSRLTEAKKHLIIQIQELIKQNRINKLGLITFNHQTKISHPLTDNFDEIIREILRQQAKGQTALYDSLKFAANQLKASKNPRILIMTDGQDNCSKQRDMEWAREWFEKDGLKSTFFTICQGDNQRNQQLAQTLQSKYIKLGEQCWFSNSFNDESMVRGVRHLE